jgi:hypothetical protein
MRLLFFLLALVPFYFLMFMGPAFRQVASLFRPHFYILNFIGQSNSAPMSVVTNANGLEKFKKKNIKIFRGTIQLL